jgi:type IV secretion system T-DNA border endonuclease VirD2
MTRDAEQVWRLPDAVKGEDVRLHGHRAGSALSPAAKARLQRIVRKAPEAMVKVTGRTRGGPGHLKAHLDYITRNGRLQAETQDGRCIVDRAGLRALHDDWLLANAAESRGRNSPNATQSIAIILSMPPGTRPDRVEAAARTWARETFNGSHDWLMARHDDTDHPHVHVTVRAVGSNGLRLRPGPNDLQQWRERFARELRRLGVEAEATPRQARGKVQKAARLPVHKAEQRGIEPRVYMAEKKEAQQHAGSAALPQPRAWSRDIQARQDSIRRSYLAHAEALGQGDAADRQLARDIRRFVADMPVPLTRRQAMAVELRHVLERHPDRHPVLATSLPSAEPKQTHALKKQVVPQLDDSPRLAPDLLSLSRSRR